MTVRVIKSNVIFDRYVDGDPPHMEFHVRARRPDGKVRTIYGSIPIEGASLVDHIKALKPGEEVSMTDSTDWRAKGLPRTLLAVGPPAPPREAIS